jgi:small-conductance mechanosensitive channel
MFDEFGQTVVLGNTLDDYLVCLAVFVLGLLAVEIIRRVVVRRMRDISARTATTVDDFIVSLIERKAPPLLYFGAFYVATRGLYLSPPVQHGLSIVGLALLSYLAVNATVAFVYQAFENFWLVRDEDAERKRTVRTLMPFVKFLILTAGILFFLSNMGFNVSTFVTGLGIGGVAVALAAQAILGDLFSYFSILIDKPFERGDFIVVGDMMGEVEHVGLKTTRVRSLGGEQLVFSNSDLTSSRIKNYKRMRERRVEFRFGIVYQSPLELVRAVPGIVRSIVEAMEGVRIDRAHFAGFGDSSLDFAVVYYVLSPDYAVYMDRQQEINLRLMEEFSRRSIEFAYPTRTVYVERGTRPSPDDIIGELDLGLGDLKRP